MNSIRFIKAVTCIALYFIFSIHVQAQMSSAQTVNPNLSAQQVRDFSKKVENYLASKGARVALISRVGRDQKKLPEGLQYTHTGIAVYSQIQVDENTVVPGYKVYNLYQKPAALNRSELVTDLPYDFYLAGFSLKSAIIIPKLSVQKKLYDVIHSPAYEKLHNLEYSLIANPYNNRYQNCNEFIMNLIFAALYNTSDMQTIKNLQKQYFTQPYVVPYSGLSIMLGAFFSKEVQANDHATSKYKTTSFGSIQNFFQQYDLLQTTHQFSE